MPSRLHDFWQINIYKSQKAIAEIIIMNTVERIPITKQGYDTLKKELEHLKAVERPRNIQAIEEARAHGDLSENAEYHAAKERQAFIEKRVSELGYKILNAQVIDPELLAKDRVVFGCRVILENIDTGESTEYQLVGPDESNVEKGLISIASPLGNAIIGKIPGDIINFIAPSGKRSYELVEIL